MKSEATVLNSELKGSIGLVQHRLKTSEEQPKRPQTPKRLSLANRLTSANPPSTVEITQASIMILSCDRVLATSSTLPVLKPKTYPKHKVSLSITVMGGHFIHVLRRLIERDSSLTAGPMSDPPPWRLVHLPILKHFSLRSNNPSKARMSPTFSAKRTTVSTWAWPHCKTPVGVQSSKPCHEVKTTAVRVAQPRAWP